MKNNIALYLIISLVIISLNFHGCLTDNLRSKKSLKSPTHEKFFGHKKNPREINENLYNDVEGKGGNEKKINHSDGKKNLLRKKRDREDREVIKRQAELEVTKTELEELQRKIENEIVSLKNRYKSSRVNRQNDDSKMISNPRLVKIEVDTYEIDSPQLSERHNQNIKKREDISTTIKNLDFSVPKERRMISDDKSQVNNPEDEIGSKIEAIKKNFKDQIDFEKRNNEIGKSNDKFEEIKNLYTGKCARPNDAEKSVKKRSAAIEGKKKFKRHAGIKKFKKSVSENISIKNNDLDSNLITSESKIKNSLRKKRKTSHHDKSKSKKDTSHKNKHDTKHDNKVVKKSVSNKDNKLKLSVGNLNRGKRNKQAQKKTKAHVKVIKKRDRPKHLHKRHYNRWDTVERDERSVDTVDNKNSNAEAESDDGLDVLNSQDNAPIASEYKESFGGFPNDPADALNRYKRIKRYKS